MTDQTTDPIEYLRAQIDMMTEQASALRKALSDIIGLARFGAEVLHHEVPNTVTIEFDLEAIGRAETALSAR